MTSGHFRKFRLKVAAYAIAIFAVAITGATARAQSGAHEATTDAGVLQGHVHDSSGKPLAEASVVLRHVAGNMPSDVDSKTARTDSDGAFVFLAVRADAYSIRAEANGGALAAVILVNLGRNETKALDVVLSPAQTSPAGTASQIQPVTATQAKDSSAETIKAPDYFDEPQFTVAGVTQGTTAGGHGSDTVLRNSEALVKATGSLGAGPAQTGDLQKLRAEIQSQLAVEDKNDDKGASNGTTREHRASLHHRLGQIEEKLGDPLAAVHEYQTAAELIPSEPNLFDFATELMAHRALGPATAVFADGNKLFPQSARMLIGLGVAWYARGSTDRAIQFLTAASDLDPGNPTPYLFMGKILSVENVPSPNSLDHLARFQHLDPENANANYYYAVGLWKSRQSANDVNDTSSAQIEELLHRAVLLDPNLGAAYLQLGILYERRGDLGGAISAYGKAVDVSPDMEEAHYRLAQAYRRTGEDAKAREQLLLHEQLSKQAKENAERERHDIQQFVISLRDSDKDKKTPK